MTAIYVFGIFEASPGKTTVASALLRGLSKAGVDIAPLKPRSGHDFWYQHDSFLRCKEEGRLYCADIIKLKKASKCGLPYEVLNPLDTLIAPLDAGWFLKSDRIRELYLRHGDEYTKFILERYTIAEEEEHSSFFCVNEINDEGALGDEEYINRVTKGKKVYRIKSSEEWTRVYNKYAQRSVESCAERIRLDHENLLVESFSDEVYMTPGVEYDAAIGVGPGIATLYPIDKLEKVLDIKTREESMETVKASKILPLMTPDSTVDLPPLSEEELKDYDLLSCEMEELTDSVQDVFDD